MKTLIYLLCIIPFLSSCSKDYNESEENTEYDITADYYFAAFIDGQKVQMELDINGYGNGAVSGGTTTSAGYQYYDGTVFVKGFSPNNSAGILIFKTFSDYPGCDQVFQIYHKGPYSYGAESLSGEEVGRDGALVYYVDSEGVQWSSGFQVEGQSNSTFEIVECNDLQTFYSNKVVKAKFECTLYNSNGDSKKLIKGEAKGVCANCSN